MSALLTDRGRLTLAIYRRDFETADHLLAMMAARSERWAEATQAARLKLAPPAPLPAPSSLLLPIPGAPAGATLGDDPRERVRSADPAYQPHDRAA